MTARMERAGLSRMVEEHRSSRTQNNRGQRQPQPSQRALRIRAVRASPAQPTGDDLSAAIHCSSSLMSCAV